jgi:PAS domain S-box-containing protein
MMDEQRERSSAAHPEKSGLKQTKTTRFYNYIRMRFFFIAIIALAGTGYFWISSEYHQFTRESQSLRQRFINQQKHVIRREVANVRDIISFNQQLTEERLRNNIKERVNEAWAIANNIYETSKDSRSKAEIELLIKEALRPVRFNNGRGYYFAVSMQGVEKLYPVAPQFEEQNLINLQDEKGNYVIQDEIAMVQKAGEGFVWDYWRKPDASDQMVYPKITFVKHFAPLDWYLGTGEYLDDVAHDIQDEMLNLIAARRYGRDGYIFIDTYDGYALLANGERLSPPEYFWDYADSMGNYVLQLEREAVKDSSGSFIEYYWNKMGETKPRKKTSFIQGFEEWQWMIGAGFYDDEVEHDIAKMRHQLQREIRKNIIMILGILILLSIAVMLQGHFSYRKIQRNIKIFLTFFAEAVDSSSYIPVEQLNFQEFQALAYSANEMISKRNAAKALLEESEAKFRKLAKNLGEGVVIFDTDFSFTYANPQAAIIFGMPETDLLTKNFHDFLVDDDSSDTSEQEKTIRNQLGETRILMITSTDHYDSTHQKIGSFVIIRDITETKKLQQERDANRERLRMFNKILRHDLTNDFAVIQSALRIYQQDNDPKMLEEILHQVTKGRNTITMVRNQESFLEGHSDLRPVDIQPIIQKMMLQFSKIAIESHGKCTVLADEVLHSVFENLISNAIMHGKANHVVVNLASKDSLCTIRVSDNGTGIPDPIKTHVFEEGYTYGESGHTGVGLHIVHKTIERYGGTISVIDNTPSGATFIITLKRA